MLSTGRPSCHPDSCIQRSQNDQLHSKSVRYVLILPGSLSLTESAQPRMNLDELTARLEGLGATKVLTYDDLDDKNLRHKVKEWTGGKVIRHHSSESNGPDETSHRIYVWA